MLTGTRRTMLMLAACQALSMTLGSAAAAKVRLMCGARRAGIGPNLILANRPGGMVKKSPCRTRAIGSSVHGVAAATSA